MEFMSDRKFQRGATAAVLALSLILVPGALAKKDKKKDQPSPATARVVAHLPLEGPVARQMFLQAQGGKQYLYVDQGAKAGYSVVDVSKPSQPALVKHVDSGKLRVVGSGLAITETPESDDSKTVAKSHPPTESVKVLDTSDPANPKTVQTFNGVTSILQDNGRNLVYLTNDEGLWVLSNPPERVMMPAHKKPPCTSESAIQAMPPDCE
jgi:LVIVD repeat